MPAVLPRPQTRKTFTSKTNSTGSSPDICPAPSCLQSIRFNSRDATRGVARMECWFWICSFNYSNSSGPFIPARDPSLPLDATYKTPSALGSSPPGRKRLGFAPRRGAARARRMWHPRGRAARGWHRSSPWRSRTPAEIHDFVPGFRVGTWSSCYLLLRRAQMRIV